MLTFVHFGSHVGGSSNLLLGYVVIAELLTDAKVAELDDAFFLQKQIIRFYVSMGDILAVTISNSLTNLLK